MSAPRDSCGFIQTDSFCLLIGVLGSLKFNVLSVVGCKSTVVFSLFLWVPQMFFSIPFYACSWVSACLLFAVGMTALDFRVHL